jgi:hypothetical protein
VASIGLPFYFKAQTETFDQTLNISATLIAALFSILTFILAILLFNKYGIDTALMDKRTDTVFRLLEKINGLVYAVENEKYFFTLNLGSSERKNIEEFYDRKLSFSTDYYNDLEKIFEIANSPFTPKSIIREMDSIQPPVISFDIPESEKGNYAKVYLLGHRKEDNQFGRLNMTDITLYKFIISYSNIKDAIVDWIKSNTSMNTADLNI